MSRMHAPDQSPPQFELGFDEPRSARRIWPVRELVGQVRELIEREYGDLWVEGEISNFRPAPSGHVYFTLKDAAAQLPIVLFRRQASLLGKAHEHPRRRHHRHPARQRQRRLSTA